MMKLVQTLGAVAVLAGTTAGCSQYGAYGSARGPQASLSRYDKNDVHDIDHCNTRQFPQCGGNGDGQ